MTPILWQSFLLRRAISNSKINIRISYPDLVKKLLDLALRSAPHDSTSKLLVKRGTCLEDHMNVLHKYLAGLWQELRPRGVEAKLLDVSFYDSHRGSEESRAETLNCSLLNENVILDDLTIPTVNDYIIRRKVLLWCLLLWLPRCRCRRHLPSDSWRDLRTLLKL